MLDTIVLTLSEGMYAIFEPDKFEPSARLISDSTTPLGGRGYIKVQQNPTKSELLAGNYKPRLTLTTRFNHAGRREPTLKVELSLPKLRFGNNFDELSDQDFEPVTDLLKSKLSDMGVKVWTPFLLNAPVSSIHYSKNIPLTDGTTPHYLISKIKEANINLGLDVNQTDYRNDGTSYKWHANSYEVTFYDKVRDYLVAKKSEKRAIERKDNAIQLDLFNTYKPITPFEVLRMEVRLGTRQKIKQILKLIDIVVEPTYRSLFSQNIAQKILLHYLDAIDQTRPALLDYAPKSSRDLLAELAISNPSLSSTRILQLFGLKQALSSLDIRELRAILGNRKPANWYKLMAVVQKLNLPTRTNPLAVLRNNILDFKPLKLLDYQSEMLNNDK
jgi:hypothetical protein